MNAHRAEIRAAASAVRAHTASYSWFGQRHRVLPREAAKAMGAAAARSFLVNAVQTRLYGDFYRTGGPVRADEFQRSDGVSAQRRSFLWTLSDANSGKGCTERGWRVVGDDGPHTVVEQAGLRLWLEPGEFSPVSGGQPQPGTEVTIRLPKEMRERSPGFYLALGDEALPATDAQPLVRLYFNLVPAAAATAVRALTTALNEARVPFRFKVADSPAGMARCDAAILYVPKSRYAIVAEVLSEAYAGLSDGLMPSIPALTKRLAPGVGLAEDFGDGGSFGMHRCGLLAEGVVAARDNGCRTDDERLTAVVEHLRATGIDPDAPYLHPGSTDDYPALARGKE